MNDKTLKSYGLNSYFQPIDSPVSNVRNEVLSTDMDINFPIPYGKINFTNFTRSSRIYSAIVSLSGEKGTFKDIQLAINYVFRLGGGIVFIRNGTYAVTSDIMVFEGITLIGETLGGVIIDFQTSAAQIKSVGELIYNTGTISINTNSSTVTGSGTIWTSDMIGSYIMIEGQFYLISNINGLTITIDGVFLGNSVSGDSYFIANPITNVAISTFTVQNSTQMTGSIYIEYSLGVAMVNINFTGSILAYTFQNSDSGILKSHTISSCGSGLIINNSANTVSDTIAISTMTVGDGFSINKVNTFSLFNFSAFNCAGRGLALTNSYDYSLFDYALIANAGVAMELVSTTDGNLSMGGHFNNLNDVLRLTSGNLRNTFTNLIIRNNNGWGVNILNSTNTDNLILGNIFKTNNSGNINDLGTTTKIRSNIGPADN